MIQRSLREMMDYFLLFAELFGTVSFHFSRAVLTSIANWAYLLNSVPQSIQANTEHASALVPLQKSFGSLL